MSCKSRGSMTMFGPLLSSSSNITILFNGTNETIDILIHQLFQPVTFACKEGSFQQLFIMHCLQSMLMKVTSLYRHYAPQHYWSLNCSVCFRSFVLQICYVFKVFFFVLVWRSLVQPWSLESVSDWCGTSETVSCLQLTWLMISLCETQASLNQWFSHFLTRRLKFRWSCTI